ncbi:hypothetical protein N9O19_05595 [Euryarchaeota archaeon]|nr:hypothetical protein [Euryarchaeota archaeon]
MSWFDILKNLKGKAKGKGSTLDTSRLKVNIQDDNCNKQLQAWARKLKNYSLLLRERYNGNELLKKHFAVFKEEQNDRAKNFTIRQKPTSKDFDSGSHAYLYEETYYKYEPVPENVACKAIDMLKKSTTGDYGSEDKEEIDGYSIVIDSFYEYQSNTTSLVISKDKMQLVVIGWSNGEDLSIGNDSYYEDFERGTPNNVYQVSGFYDARKFGYSWWE